MQVEGQRLTPTAGDGPPFLRHLGDDHLFGREAQSLTLHLNLTLPAPDLRREFGGLRRPDGGGHQGGALAETLPERAEVRFDRHMDQCPGVGQRFQGQHVELVGDLLPCLLIEVGPPLGGYEGPGQRLPDLDPGFRACRTAQLDQAPDESHLLLEVLVDQCLVHGRPRCQMHTVHTFGRGEEVLPQPLGDERRERGHDQQQVA